MTVARTCAEPGTDEARLRLALLLQRREGAMNP